MKALMLGHVDKSRHHMFQESVDELLPKSERLVRKEVLHIVDGVGSQFRKIAAGETLEEDRLDKDCAPESESQAKSEPQKNDTMNQENIATNHDIKLEPEEVRLMTDVPRSRASTSNEAALPSVEEGDKPPLSKELSEEPFEAPTPRQDPDLGRAVERETPGALDAQLNSTQIYNNDDLETSSSDESY